MNGIKLPYAEDSEIQVLGYLLHTHDILKVADVEQKHFYSTRNQIIFKTIIDLTDKDVEVDLVTVANNIPKDYLPKIGGLTYLTQINSAFMTSANINYHIKRLLETYKRRTLITEYTKALEDIQNPSVELVDIVCNVEDFNCKVMQEQERKKTLFNSKELMQLSIDKVKKNHGNQGSVAGVKTGYTLLDDSLNGFQRGDLIIIGARPSMGKTAFALNIAERVSEWGTVAFFSLEMAAEKIGNRLLSMKSFISSGKVARSMLDEAELTQLEKTSQKFTNNKFYLVDESKINMSKIKAKCKIINNKSNGLDIVIIDHLGLVDTMSKDNRTVEIGDITKAGKAMAKELDCAVIFLSQLNRGVELRGDKRPVLADLRESGNIEQDADVVMFLYRDEYYNPETVDKNVLEINIAKNRDGMTGTSKLMCNLKIQLISEEGELN